MRTTEVRNATDAHDIGAPIDAQVPGPPRLDRRLLLTVLAAAVAAAVAIEWLTPAAVRPDQIDTLSMIVNGAYFGGLVGGACMLAQRRPTLGYGLIAGAAWSQFVGVLACPVSGHHDYGAWWAGQIAVSLAFAVVSTTAAAISSRAAEPGRRAIR